MLLIIKLCVLSYQHLMLTNIRDNDGFLKLPVDFTYNIQRAHKFPVFHIQWMFFLPGLDLPQPFLCILLGYIFRHFCDRLFCVGYNRDIHLDISGDRGCINIDMDDLSIWSKSMKLSGDTVIKSGSDRKEYIAVAYGHIGSIGSMHSQISYKKRMVSGNGSPAHNCRYYRHLGLFHYLSENFIRSGDIYSAACQKQRTFCFLQNLNGFFQLSDVNAGVRLIPTDIYGFGIFRASQFTHHIFGKVNENRTGTASAGDVEGLFDNTSQIFPSSYSYSIFGNASGNAYDIHFLESVVSDQVSGYLAGKAYKRHAVIVGCSQSGNHIGSSGAAGNKTYAYFSRSPCVSVCFMDQSLLMAGKDDIDIILLIQFITDVNRGRSGIAEKNFHPFFLQGFYEQFVSCDLFHMRYLLSLFSRTPSAIYPIGKPEKISFRIKMP